MNSINFKWPCYIYKHRLYHKTNPSYKGSNQFPDLISVNSNFLDGNRLNLIYIKFKLELNVDCNICS